MDIKRKLEQALSPIGQPTPTILRHALQNLNVTAEELKPHLNEPSIYPYGRKLLYKSAVIEVIVMNWAFEQECAPHDHGASYGYILMVEGQATNTIFKTNRLGIPLSVATQFKQERDLFFAPKGLIHSMGNPNKTALITMHVYSPPITNMKVYDLKRCAACIVSDNCGAWWPTQQRQRLQEIKLNQLG